MTLKMTAALCDASKIETPEFIVIYFGDNCGDDSSQIIIGVKE